MKPLPEQKNLNKIWREFLEKTNGSLKISYHCLLERIPERFPELLELTENEFLDMVRDSKPYKRIEFPNSNLKGIRVRNDNIIFAVSFKTKKVMSIYPYHPHKPAPKKKGRTPKIKHPYYRPDAKKQARKAILEEL
jgi:hypothetical protein